MSTQLKSIIRRPLLTILLMLLLGAVSFGFIARTVEYLAVSRAVDDLSEYYKAIGYLSSSDGDVTQGARLLSQSDLIAINDVQRYCTGTLEGLYNADLDGSSSNRGYTVSEVFLWGELNSKFHFIPETDKKLSQEKEYYTLKFHVVERLYGYPDYAPDNGTITVIYYPEDEDTGWETVFESLQENSVYGVKAYYAGGGSYTSNLLLRRVMPDGDWFLTEGDTRAEKLANADIAQEVNRHRITISGTKNMSALPLTQEVSRDGYLIDGRWLTAADNESANLVCVILQDFAEPRGLNVGDTLTITLSDEQLSFGYYPSETVPEAVNTTDVVTKTFTIVGIYNRTIFSEGYSSASYRSLNIYIPDSCMPAGYDAATAALADGTAYDTNYSFVLTSPEVQGDFLGQYRAQLESMGYTVTFIENGWAEFSASVLPIRQSTVYSATIFAAVQLLTLLLVAFLYRRQHRREFAIARALGIPPLRTIIWHLLPITLLGAVGIALGGTLAWSYALEQVQVTLSSIVREGQSVNIELSSGVLAILCAFSVAILALFVLLALLALSRYPVMDILREVRQNKRPKETASDATTVTANLTPVAVTQSSLPKTSVLQAERPDAVPVKHSLNGLARFTRRHILRSKGNIALILAVAIAFMVALGWIQQSIQQTSQSIDEMYSSSTVDVELLKSTAGAATSSPGFIAGDTVDAILGTGFVQDSWTVAVTDNAYLMKLSGGKETTYSAFTLCGITGTENLNQELSAGIYMMGGDGEITYQNGADETLFDTDFDGLNSRYPIVVPESILDTLNVRIGSQLMLVVGNYGVTVIIQGSYTGGFNGLGISDAAPVLMPLAVLRELSGSDLYYSVAEFTLDPALNRDLDAFRTTTEQILKRDSKSLLSLNLVIWDEELRLVVRPMEQNLTLMQVLYPIAQIVSLLAAGAVALLLLLQEARTAAILRILGVKARSVQAMLAAEQLILGLFGITSGLIITALLGKWRVPLLPCAVLYFLGLMIGTLIGCIVIARKKPLELLQVKE